MKCDHSGDQQLGFRRRPGSGILASAMLAAMILGCAPPPGSQPVQPAPDPPKAKAPASTAYGKALEAAEKLKDKAQDYNDRLEKLNDPFVK